MEHSQPPRQQDASEFVFINTGEAKRYVLFRQRHGHSTIILTSAITVDTLILYMLLSKASQPQEILVVNNYSAGET